MGESKWTWTIKMLSFMAYQDKNKVQLARIILTITRENNCKLFFKTNDPKSQMFFQKRKGIKKLTGYSLARLGL